MIKNKSGQGVIEYIILVAIVAIASLGMVKILGNTITSKLAQITYSLQGKRAKAKAIRDPDIQRSDYEERGMDDFYEAAQ